MNNINNRGPKTEPCGTPAKMLHFSKVNFPMRTFCVRPRIEQGESLLTKPVYLELMKQNTMVY